MTHNPGERNQAATMYLPLSTPRLGAAVVLLCILFAALVGCREIPPLQSEQDAGADGAVGEEGGAGADTDAAVNPCP